MFFNLKIIVYFNFYKIAKMQEQYYQDLLGNTNKRDMLLSPFLGEGSKKNTLC